MAITRRTSPHARQLRRNMTDAERYLWHALRARRFAGWKFRRQVSVGPFVADFLCHAARLIVEVDGGQHSAAVDAQRTALLESMGYRVARYWNHEVLENIEGVLRALEVALGHPHPSSASS
ncbi:endonuclease domain-containing protein [Novosphingobium sp. PS1R-30]|uniref:Endonuclease domain-containing protein n=1 Tax=Novosphingobium anseongense TaxID=3133436 RepID=A0ABU8RSY3_9SPHN